MDVGCWDLKTINGLLDLYCIKYFTFKGIRSKIKTFNYNTLEMSIF